MTDARKDLAIGKACEQSKQIQSHPEYTKEQLQDQLVDFLAEMDEYEFDEAKLDSILNALDEYDTMPEPLDTEESLAQFHRNYAPVFESVEADSSAAISPSSPRKRTRRPLLKLLPIAAVLILMLGSISAQAAGFSSLWAAITSWTSDIFSLGAPTGIHAAITERPLAVGETATFDTLQDALDAFGVDAPLAPHWLPDRFVPDTIRAYYERGTVKITADYICEGGYLSFLYREVTPDATSFETDSAPSSKRIHYGIKHYFVSDLDRYKAAWQNGELICSIDGTVSLDEMEEIVRSIYDEI